MESTRSRSPAKLRPSIARFATHTPKAHDPHTLLRGWPYALSINHTSSISPPTPLHFLRPVLRSGPAAHAPAHARPGLPPPRVPPHLPSDPRLVPGRPSGWQTPRRRLLFALVITPPNLAGQASCRPADQILLLRPATRTTTLPQVPREPRALRPSGRDSSPLSGGGREAQESAMWVGNWRVAGRSTARQHDLGTHS